MSSAAPTPNSRRRSLIILAGPSGCKTAVALARIIRNLPTNTRAATRDVEHLLVEHVKQLIRDHETSSLGKRLRETFAKEKRDDALEEALARLEIQDLFWELPRDLVSELWGRTTTAALQELRHEDADILILKTHFVYYRGETFEFFTSASASVFQEFDVRRIIVLIDDIFDMYVRLTGTRQVFDFQVQLYREQEKIEASEGESADKRRLPPNACSALDVVAERYRLAISIVVRNLLRTLTWREKEILAAESLGSDLRAPVFVLAVKHPIHIAVALVTEADAQPNTYLTYLSHPISRPRKEEKNGNWPFVPEYHAFVNTLRTHEGPVRCIPVMPTAIDEFRIRSVEEQYVGIDGRPYVRDVYVPELRTRWPLLLRDPSELLYALPQGISLEEWNRELNLIFNPPLRPDSGERLMPSVAWQDLPPGIRQEISGMLHALMVSIRQQMAARDHLLVRQCPGFLLYRPLHKDYDASFSGGVGSEIENWERINRLVSRPIDRHRPILFIHHDDDQNEVHLTGNDWSVIEKVLSREIDELTGYSPESIPEELRQGNKNWFRKLLKQEGTIDGGMPPARATALRTNRRAIEDRARTIIDKRRAHALTSGAADVPGTICAIHPFTGNPSTFDERAWKALVSTALLNWNRN